MPVGVQEPFRRELSSESDNSFRIGILGRRKKSGRWKKRHSEVVGARTRDLRIKSPLLYQLSYNPAGKKTCIFPEN